MPATHADIRALQWTLVNIPTSTPAQRTEGGDSISSTFPKTWTGLCPQPHSIQPVLLTAVRWICPKASCLYLVPFWAEIFFFFLQNNFGFQLQLTYVIMLLC